MRVDLLYSFADTRGIKLGPDEPPEIMIRGTRTQHVASIMPEYDLLTALNYDYPSVEKFIIANGMVITYGVRLFFNTHTDQWQLVLYADFMTAGDAIIFAMWRAEQPWFIKERSERSIFDR